jgi:amidase
MQGVHPLAQSFDAAGWFARTPDMLARVGSVMLGKDIPGFRARRLIVARDLFSTSDAALAAKYDALLKRLSGHFAGVMEAEVGRPDFTEWIETLRCIQWWELNQAHGEWIFRHLDAFGAEIRGRLEKIPSVSRAEMEAKRETRKQLTAQIESMLTPGTLIILPTAPGIAPLKGRSIEEARAGRLNTLRHTCIAAVAGLPQVSMPLLEVGGCPLGISLMGARGQDGQLLAAAQIFGKVINR